MTFIERVGADRLQRLRKGDAPQCVVFVESHIADRLQGRGKFDRFEYAAIGERLIGDSGHSVGNTDGFERRAIHESLRTERGQPFGQFNTLQCRTFVEGPRIDRLHSGGNRHALQTRTSGEEAARKRRDLFGHDDVGQRLAVIERILADRSQRGRQPDGREFRAARERPRRNLGQPVGQCDRLQSRTTVERCRIGARRGHRQDIAGQRNLSQRRLAREDRRELRGFIGRLGEIEHRARLQPRSDRREVGGGEFPFAQRHRFEIGDRFGNLLRNTVFGQVEDAVALAVGGSDRSRYAQRTARRESTAGTALHVDRTVGEGVDDRDCRLRQIGRIEHHGGEYLGVAVLRRQRDAFLAEIQRDGRRTLARTERTLREDRLAGDGMAARHAQGNRFEPGRHVGRTYVEPDVGGRVVQHERTVGIGRRIAEIAVAPQIGTTGLRLCLFGGDRRRAGGGTRHVVDHVVGIGFGDGFENEGALFAGGFERLALDVADPDAVAGAPPERHDSLGCLAESGTGNLSRKTGQNDFSALDGTGGFDIGIPRTSREGQQRTADKI